MRLPEGSTAAAPNRTAWTAIVMAWLVAGTADIVIACVYYPLTTGVAVTRLLQGIASGLLGAKAFTGGTATVALGLACHYGIALIWTVCFFAVYPVIGILHRNRFLTATLYGVFVSAVMSFVVLPLSHVAPRPFRLGFFVVATVILVFSIGLPLSILAGRYYAHRTPSR